MFDPLAHLDLSAQVAIFVPKIAAATAVGGIVGIERELRNKTVGLKTNILICAGSTLFSTVSALMIEGDPTRVPAQIVSGIGFLGAGAIFKEKDRVRGLTTAAFIWVVAALGFMIGQGASVLALLLGVGLVGAIEILTFIEDNLLYRKKNKEII